MQPTTCPPVLLYFIHFSIPFTPTQTKRKGRGYPVGRAPPGWLPTTPPSPHDPPSQLPLCLNRGKIGRLFVQSSSCPFLLFTFAFSSPLQQECFRFARTP
eukprot:Hpha_TRINITY_DN16750_c0_g1::TRINITY_DN16750_c0_g1_i2::g.79859::m.79859